MSIRALLAGLLSGVAAFGCMDPHPAAVRCHRYEAGVLPVDRGSGLTVSPFGDALIDEEDEYLELSLTIVRPVRGPVTLVYIRGDVEAGRWDLTPPDGGLTTRCWLSPTTSKASCGADLQSVPQEPAGFYYLVPNGNVILEAALAFRLCH